MTPPPTSVPHRQRSLWPPSRHPRRRRGVRMLAIALGLALALSVGAGAVVAARGQSALMSQSQQFSAARHALDDALARARADGLTDEQLAAIRRDRERLLAEPAIPNTLGLFDAGQAAHLGRQAAALRALVPRIDLVRNITTDHDRRAALAIVDDFDAAIAAASEAGLPVVEDQSRATMARRAVMAARSPAALSRATAHLADRSAEVRTATDAKVAADTAAAELSARRDQAQAALSRAADQLTQASAIPQLQVAAYKSSLDELQAAFTAATAPAEYQSVAGRANQVGSALRTLLKSRSDAYQSLSSARQVVQQATAAKLDVGSISAQLDGVAAQLDAVGTADQFRAILAQIDGLVNPLAERLGIVELGAGKVMVISLEKQTLTAYEDGHIFLTTLVTTGRPALPTPTGATTVTSKSHPWHMTSDWPKDSPYWYPPSDVNYVLWFRCCGYGIHDAPWRSTYGPGTQAQGSHGCVNVPGGRMPALFNWAEVGTRVIVR
ncbi:MAG: L,D-transpeptidase family protein [Candidatus Dormibacteria bacterium]